MNNIPDPNLAGSPASITPSDIYYTLFRHKWKIVICATIGFIAAAAIYLYYPKSFSSQARLFIRYVEKGKAPISAEDNNRVQTVDNRGDSIINSELQIITSMDLALQIAEKLGPDRILEDPTKKHETADAGKKIRDALSVSVPRNSSVIAIQFSHPDESLTQPVLQELIDSYLVKHSETRSAGQLTSFINQQAEQYRTRVAKTEAELKDALDRAGVFSLDEGKADQNSKISRLRGALMDSTAELAARKAGLKQLEALSTPKSINPENDTETTPESFEQIDQGTLQAYASIQARLDLLLRNERDLLMKYTLGNAQVQSIQTQIEETRQRNLEEKHPMLIATAPTRSQFSSSPQNPGIDFRAEAIQVAALESKINVLESQLAQLLQEAEKLSSIEIEIQELLRRKTVEEEQYRYFSQSREEAKIDQAFGAGAVNGIGIVQLPSPPQSNATDSMKFAGIAAIGGLALGLVWPFLIELYLDRSIKRPIDVKRSLKIPLFLSIPDSSSRRYQKLLKKRGMHDAVRRAKRAKSNKTEEPFNPSSPALKAAAKAEPEKYSSSTPASVNGEAGPMDGDHTLQPYYEALRDRMIGFFEGRGLVHKPKLIGLTGIGDEPGTTTVAAGLASTLSKTGEGNVLLVDMTLGQESAKQFYHGKAVTNLEDLLDEIPKEKKNEGKLVVAAEGSNGYKLPKILPNRFNDLVPKLKASDFDYIIFDMPPVSPISVTPRLASFMDSVLMVIESEKATKDVVQRATELLEKTNQNVGAILNKTKSYVPSSLQEEYLGDL